MTTSLIPDIPEEERIYFERFNIMFSKLVAAIKLERGQSEFFESRFNSIIKRLEEEEFNKARTLMGECLMGLQTLRDPSFGLCSLSEEQYNNIKEFIEKKTKDEKMKSGSN